MQWLSEAQFKLENKRFKMRKILIAGLFALTLVGCTGESNEETETAFNAGKLIDCRTGFFQDSHNLISNTDYKYHKDLMLFTNGTSTFAMGICYSRI